MNTIWIFIIWVTAMLSYAYDLVGEGFNIKKMATIDISPYSHELIRCAYQCLASYECCVATYHTTNHTCIFDTCCFEYQGNVSQTQTIKIVKTSRLVDCSDLACGTNVDGVYEIFPGVQFAVNVYCYFGENNNSWTVIQQRLHGGVNFTRNWEDYKVGFGSPTTDYWIGNDILHTLTHRRAYTLRFDMEDFAGNTAFAEYTMFLVEDEATKYRLTAEGYSGNAGDAFGLGNGMMFSTFDSDNDAHESFNCAKAWKSGWWILSCGQCNPNGLFSQVEIVDKWWTIHWSKWHFKTQLKTIDMKITPRV